MKLTIFIIGIIYSSVSWSNSIYWSSPESFSNDKILNCNVAREYIRGEIERILKTEGDRNIEPQSIIWLAGKNKVRRTYYILSVLSVSRCGSAGCSSRLFVPYESECKEYPLPNIQPSALIGVNESGEILFRLREGKCSIWQFEGDELKYKTSINEC